MPCIRYRFSSGALYRWEFERGGIEVDIDVEGPLTLNDQDLMVDAALDGAGLAFVFEAQVEELIAKRRLVRVLADWCPAYPGFFLYYPSRRQCRPRCGHSSISRGRPLRSPDFAPLHPDYVARTRHALVPGIHVFNSGERTQLPLNTGLRFSINACTASL